MSMYLYEGEVILTKNAEGALVLKKASKKDIASAPADKLYTAENPEKIWARYSELGGDADKFSLYIRGYNESVASDRNVKVINVGKAIAWLKRQKIEDVSVRLIASRPYGKPRLIIDPKIETVASGGTATTTYL